MKQGTRPAFTPQAVPPSAEEELRRRQQAQERKQKEEEANNAVRSTALGFHSASPCPGPSVMSGAWSGGKTLHSEPAPSAFPIPTGARVVVDGRALQGGYEAGEAIEEKEKGSCTNQGECAVGISIHSHGCRPRHRSVGGCVRERFVDGFS
jgi:hypothetical protein